MRSLPIFLILLFTVGCEDSPSSNADPDLNPDAGMSDAGGPQIDPCDLQDEKLMTVLEKVRTSPHAALAVIDPACGNRTYLSGDAALASEDSLFRIGSVTKTYVAAVIVSLVQDGKVSLEDPLAQWLPDLPGIEGVTVRMLLNHTSGIFNYTEDASIFAGAATGFTPAQIVEIALTHEATSPPGEAYAYSNTNYILLGMIAELAGEAKLGDLLEERAFAPADLSATFLDGEQPWEGMLAPGYSGTGDDVTYALHPSVPWAAGSMVASPADLAQWITALYAGEVLNEQGSALLVQDPVPMGGGTSYGLGTVILPASATVWAGPAYGHTGGIPGYATLVFYFPEARLTLAAIVNQDGADANAILLEALLTLRPERKP